uniref:DET1- and DDB1-associated protein 1 n=1 Tax=Helianthus annuus TaxID=4232 RepID=A0A251RKU0_HELAN
MNGLFHPPTKTLLVISSEAKNILLRQFYQRGDEKLRPKRAAPENLSPEQECKHPRASFASSSEPPK